MLSFLSSFRLSDRHVSALKGIAGLVVIYGAVEVSRFAWKYYLRPSTPLRRKYEGSWAIITGASGGIGLGIAHEFAGQGINVVLVARNKERLNSTADALKSKFPGVDTRVVSIDAESATSFQPLLEATRGLNIALLVNNVGVHNDIPTTVEEMTPQEVKRIIDVNCTFQVQITSAVLPQMKETLRRQGQGTGRPMVVNVSSLTSKMAMPLLSVYAATKAFEEHFTEGLGAELQGDGIDVICLRPGLTVSAMSGETVPSLFCPSAETMAKACVRMLDCGEVSVAPYGPHAFLDWVNGLVPRQTTWKIVREMHQKKRDCLLEKRK